MNEQRSIVERLRARNGDGIRRVVQPDRLVDEAADKIEETLRTLGGYHDAVETLLTLPEGGMRDVVITKLADAHLAAKAVLR